MAGNDRALAVRDAFPVSPGHTLVVPRRHVARWADVSTGERDAMLALADRVMAELDAFAVPPDGYNLGINLGAAAGQTVPHLQLHVIPRYRGDMDDPRGGVRHVIPHRGNYLRAAMPPLATGGPDDPFLHHLRPLLARAREVAIVTASVRDDGLDLLERELRAARERGARIRIVTADALHVGQVRALQRLLDWTRGSEVRGGEARAEAGDRALGSFETRVVPADEQNLASFHPRSWRFEGPGLAIAFVGSSDLSRTALQDGVEWNLRVERDGDPEAYRQVVEAFERWWGRALPLETDRVTDYAERARRAGKGLPPGEVDAEAAETLPEPHHIQVEALHALGMARAEGRGRALVVMATGLGKTRLVAFDLAALQRRLGRMPRVLFLAHRAARLEQAAATLRRAFPDARSAWLAGTRTEVDGDMVFASVETLASADHLATLSGQRFDYAVVDEVHRAGAASLRRVLARLDAGFVVGLTATPDRADEAGLAGVFDDDVAYRADLGAGIATGLLAPFAYHGLRDVVDYEHVPWRNRRFDPDALAAAVATERRMERLWEGWQAHPARRTLVVCCSSGHAHFVKAWLAGRGVAVAAVHAGPGSDAREDALAALREGRVAAVCGLDRFDDGVDLPAVDRVVMLSPTESPVVFLEQVGRALRRAAGKDAVVVVDFVGDHPIFLDRVRTLVALGPRPVTLRQLLEEGLVPGLPPGCSLDVEVEALDVLRRLLPTGAREMQRAYRDLRAARGERPTAGQLFRMGWRPSVIRAGHGSWFDFVAAEGDLSAGEQRAFPAAREWLRAVETAPMRTSLEMVVLDVLLDAEALRDGMALDELGRRCHARLAREPELLRDLEHVRELPERRAPEPARWLEWWRANPVAAWCARGWFREADGRLVSQLPDVGADALALATMTRELVDLRLGEYEARRRTMGTGSAFECTVIANQREAILRLPPAAQRPAKVSGEIDVRLPDGASWRFRFGTEACQVAWQVGKARNMLPDLLREWFGPGAERPGTGLRVRFERSADGWRVGPAGEATVTPPEPAWLTYLPSLRAAAAAAQAMAAGHATEGAEVERIQLPIGEIDADCFAVRAAGDAMDGGDEPIRDGDFLVMRCARAASLGDLEGRVALIDLGPERGWQLRRVARDDAGWVLRSENPALESWPAPQDTLAVAVLERVVRMEEARGT